jgi:hypothetical protein
MYTLEFDANIGDQALPLPAEVASKVSRGQHVRVILLVDEAMPTDTANASVENPLAALLKSELIGCAEADPTLSRNYKAEFSESLGTKHGYR